MVKGNSASPHGGGFVERVRDPADVDDAVWRLPAIPLRRQLATECIGLAYGFFAPLEGFMGRAELDSVANEMRLGDGLVWSIPIVFDVTGETIAELGVETGGTYLLTYEGAALATLEVDEIYAYDRERIARLVYGTTDAEHPGVRRALAFGERFLGGRVTLVNPPRVNEPYEAFWLPPARARKRFEALGWSRIVAFQTRNVPHVGHEWLMKGAWFHAHADGVLDNPVIGEKKEGDAIDEAILAGHAALVDSGYFKPDVHTTAILLWDMRYAGPREAVFHALVRKNMGCTHHVFGRDHAGVGDYYDPFAAHRIFDELPDLGIEPVFTQGWTICEKCGPAYTCFCDHPDSRRDISGTWMRKLISEGEKPPGDVFRPEVFGAMLDAGERYGFGSPFVSDRYLERRAPVFTIPALAEAA